MSSAIFPWFRKYPKLYVWGCPREKILSRSANRPSARRKAKLARKNCEILPKNNSKKLALGY